MEKKFKRGDVIKENFETTIRYVVLSTVEPECIRVFSASGYTGTILKDHEKHYKKVGHIDLAQWMEQIKKAI